MQLKMSNKMLLGNYLAVELAAAVKCEPTSTTAVY